MARSAGITAEFASVAPALADDEDAFSEIPTVANPANPTASPGKIDKVDGQGLGGAGAYRMVRPATSDTLAPPAPAKRPSGNRVIIGVARKTQS